MANMDRPESTSKQHRGEVKTPTARNPQPECGKTYQRNVGGNTVPATSEKHGQRKSERIPADRRFDGAENVTPKASPGR